MMPTPRKAPEQRITTREAAEGLMIDLTTAMDDLLGVLAKETTLVRAGRLRQARDLTEAKNDLAAAYTRLMLLARDEVAVLASFLPEETEALKRRHELFRAEVQINLAVIATARDVAEDLIRQVANDVTAPPSSGYAASGRSTAATGAPEGFTLSKNL
jgi:hypothetical protein